MIQHVTHLYGFNLGLARSLVNDLTSEQMVAQPHGVINPPAWTLGHLTMAADNLAAFLGLEPQAPAGWDKTFATGGTPSGELAAYPSKEELLAALTAQHERNTAAARGGRRIRRSSASPTRTSGAASTFRPSATSRCS